MQYYNAIIHQKCSNVVKKHLKILSSNDQLKKGGRKLANLLLLPAKIITGTNALNQAGLHLKQCGSKALIVTDKMMLEIGSVQRLINIMQENSIDFKVFAEVNAEPTEQIVNQGVDTYRQHDCDFLVAIGGGSPIDAMKAIGALVAHQGALADYMGKEFSRTLPRMVAIPTTAGTGSEATQFTIISNTRTNVKMLLKGAVLIPALAIVDPILTVSAPPNVVAATGLDALTHAIEAYTSKKAQPLSDTFALSACQRIFENLRKSYYDSEDLSAKEQMSLASLEAGIAFNNASVTLVHGMSRPIGALFHVPHGISNAILLKDCLAFAKEGAPRRFADIARAAGFSRGNDDDQQAAEQVVTEVEKLCKDLRIPNLEEFGVDRQEFFQNINKMTADALQSGSPQNTRRGVDTAEIIAIYKKLWA
ncbi:alcohol dehydrogenase class IV [Anaerospora hongkongensis]|uniref:Alcohol dehydrogenase class IV n=1 Tax=Anaerospora hongkongensis TaxID=244830 RepID=A0A4R1PN33_9FIRM|nr:alcohol dehydrogenase class IV [Anaerospora hongkongensis]